MNARTAARRCGSPRSTMRSKHSDLADSTNLSAKRVQVGTPRRENQGLHATVAQQLPEGVGIERVSVQDNVLNAAQEAVAGVGQVPRELRHPRAVRLRRDPGDLYGAALQLHDEEDDVADQTVQGQHFD